MGILFVAQFGGISSLHFTDIILPYLDEASTTVLA